MLLKKKPKYALLGKDKLLLINNDGEAISSSESSSLPVLATDSQLPEIGKKVDEQTLFALEIVYNLYSSYRVSAGSLEDRGLVVKLQGGPEVIFPREGDKKLLLGSFNLIYSRLNSLQDESKIEYGKVDKMIVDLRFKKPVIY